MVRYVVLLVGVNIGGRKVVMATLRSALAVAGFVDVTTYVQSGNVVLSSPDPPDAVRDRVLDVAEQACGVRTRAVVRTRPELLEVVRDDPLAEIAIEPARHVVGFMSAAPEPAALASFEQAVAGLPTAGDRHAFSGRHFYLWCPNGISKSPYFNAPWKKLGVDVTQRNYNTVGKLIDLAEEQRGGR